MNRSVCFVRQKSVTIEREGKVPKEKDVNRPPSFLRNCI